MLILGDENQSRSFPIVNVSIVIACTLITVMVFGGMNAESVIKEYGCVPARFLAHQDWAQIFTLLSSTFLHAGLFHLIGNMWFLLIFGDNIEDHFGHFNYAFFYLTCGIVSALVQLAADPGSTIPCVGASGAIAGVMGAYIVLYPHAKVQTYWGGDFLLFAFRTFQIPAWGVLGIWFVMQYISLSLGVPGIGWHAHISGFITGIAIVWLFRMCGEKCSDNNSQNHQGGHTMQSYAYSRGSIPAQGSTSLSIAKPMLAILLAGALTTCGTFYLLQRANSKSASAQPIAAQPAKAAHSTDSKVSGKNAQKKGHSTQKSRHGKTSDRHRKHSSVVS